MLQDKSSYIETFHKVIEESNKRSSRHIILIVDDEPDNLSLLRRTFRSKYEVLTANNGKEALDIVKEKADEITLSNDENGVAVFLEKLLLFSLL